MAVEVIGPASDPANRAKAADALVRGATVVVWDLDADALGAFVADLPPGPGRLATFTGEVDSPAFDAFISEVLDREVK